MVPDRTSSYNSIQAGKIQFRRKAQVFTARLINCWNEQWRKRWFLFQPCSHTGLAELP